MYIEISQKSKELNKIETKQTSKQELYTGNLKMKTFPHQ